MFSWIRQKFGPVVLTGIVVAIGSVFVLSDFLTPRAGRGLTRGGGVAGSVNGESIGIGEFSRELGRRTEQLKQMTGGKLTEEQIKLFRIRESVFNELVQRKLVLQDCRKSGIVPADEEVRAKIQELPYFQKDGKFDLVTYRSLLTNNQLNPGKFEEMVRDDLTMQKWSDLVRSRVQVSSDEVQREFRVSNDKRNIKYVVLDLEAGRKGVQVPGSEVDAFLKDTGKQARVKARFEQDRQSRYKDKKFEAVQQEIARELIASEKVEEARKVNQGLAAKVEGLLGAGSDASVNALLKPYGVSVKTSGLITAEQSSIAGVADSAAILKDAFADKSPIHVKEGGKARKYEGAASVVVAAVFESKKPEMAKLAAESSKLEQQIRTRKERELEQQWIEGLKEKAKIKMNADVISGPASDSDVG